MNESDALIVGTPVYYGQPNGGILSLMQRLFYSAGHLVQNKPADGWPSANISGTSTSICTTVSSRLRTCLQKHTSPRSR